MPVRSSSARCAGVAGAVGVRVGVVMCEDVAGFLDGGGDLLAGHGLLRVKVSAPEAKSTATPVTWGSPRPPQRRTSRSGRTSYRRRVGVVDGHGSASWVGMNWRRDVNHDTPWGYSHHGRAQSGRMPNRQTAHPPPHRRDWSHPDRRRRGVCVWRVPMPAADAQKALATRPDLEFAQVYGMTEMGRASRRGRSSKASCIAPTGSADRTIA